jgi:chemotaxis-related protein WspB
MLLIMCHAGADRFAVDSRHVSEVLPRANLQRPGGAPPWLAGLLIYRGTAAPVIDLVQLTQGGVCPNRLSSRIVVLRTDLDGVERKIGLLAENVGLCEVDEAADAMAETTAKTSRGPTAWGSLRLDAQGVFQVIDLRLLLCKERRDVLFPAPVEKP